MTDTFYEAVFATVGIGGIAILAFIGICSVHREYQRGRRWSEAARKVAESTYVEFIDRKPEERQ